MTVGQLREAIEELAAREDVAATTAAQTLMPVKRSRRQARVSMTIPSPDRRHEVQVTKRTIRLDGKRLRTGKGKLHGQPVWRHDSQALAFLQGSPFGPKLVVVTLSEKHRTLVWHLPPIADELTKVFWISPRRVGIGFKEMVPQLVVNWSVDARPLY